MVLCANISSKELYAVQIDENAKIVSRYDLGCTGSAFDIVSTPWGFAALYSKSYMHLGIVGVNSDGTQKFKRTIMDNTDCSSWDGANNQMFLGSTKFGLNCIYNPHNEKLIYASGKIFMDFAHYNQFQNYGEHSGNSIFSIDEDGKNEQIINSWHVSHSLSQRLTKDDSYILEASLSDAYPLNIGFMKMNFDGRWQRKNEKLLDGTIPGNGAGKSDGRLGGIIAVGPDRYACAYSRKPGTSYEGTVSDADELGILFYNSNLELEKKVVLNEGTPVNAVMIANYKSNILISYSQLQESSINFNEYNNEHVTGDTQDMYIMLLDIQGNVLNGPDKVERLTLQADTNFVTLADGRVVWAFVDSSNNAEGNVEYFVTDWLAQ